MDLEDFHTMLANSRVDLWTLIDTAITVASVGHGPELKNRRDRIVERLYAAVPPPCPNCDGDRPTPNGQISSTRGERRKSASPSTPQSIHREDDDDDDEGNEQDPYAGLFDDEEMKLLRIKEDLEDPDQTEDSLVELLQSLADRDITFKALTETDIGRQVNRFRKHSSNNVRKLVKHLIRKWKYIVDEWVSVNRPGEAARSDVIAGEDSPQQSVPRNSQNGHHQIPDFGYSPNPHNGSSGSEKNNSEPEPKPKAVPRQEAPVKREAPAKRPHSVSAPASAPPLSRPQRDTSIDMERLASARRRLHENYQEAENAKKQRTIQVMDIHEIPKPKNTFFGKNRGGGQGRHHR